ncbi:MAG: hypothetical protein ACUVR8_04045 [Acidobacteriota bacterium]
MFQTASSQSDERCPASLPIARLIIAAPASGHGKSTITAALVHGFHTFTSHTFTSKVNIAGVICNCVGGERHDELWHLSPRLHSTATGPCAIPERHLGLAPVDEHPSAVQSFLRAAQEAIRLVERCCAWRTSQGAPAFWGSL